MEKEGINSEKTKSKTKTVDEYIAAAPPGERSVLEELRKAIKAASPGSEELISYQIPTYKYNGPLVHFAAFKNHNSFIVVDNSILEIFKEELEDFDISGTTVHFTAENPLPEILVKNIVKERMKQNEKIK
ncbi:MAG: iron chaperone [Methanomicrobiales archaeon]